MTCLRVQRPAHTETTALGAAMLAGVGAGVYESLEGASQAWAVDASFVPGMEPARRGELISGYQRAVNQALSDA